MPTLSEILEVRKGKHGIVEITAVQLPTSSDGKSEEVDLVARHEKLDQPYEVIVNSKTWSSVTFRLASDYFQALKAA